MHFEGAFPSKVMKSCELPLRHFFTSHYAFLHFSSFSVKFMLSHLTIAADPSLARFDVDSLSDQIRMELLIGGLKETLRYEILTDDGEFKDVCDWTDIQCNSDGNVTKVEMLSYASPENGETLNLVYMPPLVTTFSFAMVGASGSLDTQALPAGLQILSVTQTEKISGPIETAYLPRGITELDLNGNAFDGKLDLTVLPPGLVLLNVHSNKFTGSVNLTKLPKGLEDLYLANNQFVGELDFGSLPGRIEEIDVSENRFSGSFVLKKVPQTLQYVNVSACRSIIGVAVVAKSFPGEVWLKGTGVIAVTDEIGRIHAMERAFLTFRERDWETLDEAEFDDANWE